MACAAAYWIQDGVLSQGTPEAYFSGLIEKEHVISLVGGGGKSSLQRYLCAAFAKGGMKTAAITTTKICRPLHFCRTIEECRPCWSAGEYAICGEPYGENKLSMPDDAALAALLAEADAIVVEADGAHGLPIKAPAPHEPVILPQSDIVIAVMGLDALDEPVERVCHRPEQVCALLCCDMQHRLTCRDAVRMLLSQQGARKGVGERAFYAVLNKCDDARRLAMGEDILHILRREGFARAVLTAGMHL